MVPLIVLNAQHMQCSGETVILRHEHAQSDKLSFVEMLRGALPRGIGHVPVADDLVGNAQHCRGALGPLRGIEVVSRALNLFRRQPNPSAKMLVVAPLVGGSAQVRHTQNN